jgi:dienelactone hydrolase
MKRYKWLILAVVVALAALAVVYRQPLVLRVTGIRPFVEERFNGWVRAGAEEAELDAVLKRIHDPRGDGPGSWVYELAQVAAAHEQRAKNAADGAVATDEYRKAAVYYYIARFPFVSSPAKEKAYRDHIRCYLEGAKSFDPPLEVVRIPFEGKEIVGYLRIPMVEKPAVVLFTGGVDTWKSDFDQVVEALLAKDLAVLAIDMPGTGESAWNLGPDSEKVHNRAIEWLRENPRIDGERTGLLMISFGGYFAVKLALTDTNVKASVNVGGPVALSFTKENAQKVPQLMVATIAHAMGVDPSRPLEELTAEIEPLSLANLLKSPKHQAALLSINGDLDPLVPIDDLYVISKAGVPQEEWVYEGDGHCAPENQKEWAPKAAEWLKEKLS